MQDMSGFVMSDTTLQPLDEQLLSISTAQTENDFCVQNPGLPSPAEYILGDTTESVISEDSNMFDTSQFEILTLSPHEYRFEPPVKGNQCTYKPSDQPRTLSNMDKEERIPLPSKDLSRPKMFGNENRKPKYLAIIDSEEPHIKEDPVLYCTQNKMDFDIKADSVSAIFKQEPTIMKSEETYYSEDMGDLDVAGEVIVVTEAEDTYTNENIYIDEPAPEEDLKTEEKPKPDVLFQLDPFLSIEKVLDDLFNDIDPEGNDPYGQIQDDNVPDITPEAIEEDYNATLLPPVEEPYTFTNNDRLLPTQEANNTRHQAATDKQCNNCQIPSKPVFRPPLTLDIKAARAALFDDKGISDTPELLEALKPEDGKFDLIKFITTNGDPNNNSPTVETPAKRPEAPRKGKSHLSLEDLKEAQTCGRGRGRSLSREDDEEPFPSTSTATSSKRPARQSATRFKKMIEKGLLGSVDDSQSVSSDNEDEPKSKRRRTNSTSSSRRRRINSDSDHSSISEDAMKYRERRDKNNLSSKRSRQKRKEHHLMKQKELKELEERNAELKKKKETLESAILQAKLAWETFAHTKDNDKDRGDRH